MGFARERRRSQHRRNGVPQNALPPGEAARRALKAHAAGESNVQGEAIAADTGVEGKGEIQRARRPRRLRWSLTLCHGRVQPGGTNDRSTEEAHGVGDIACIHSTRERDQNRRATQRRPKRGIDTPYLRRMQNFHRKSCG
eukprot:scaffold1484_cov241-Pinguiococcus_pyrenoidosus.AAC.21